MLFYTIKYIDTGEKKMDIMISKKKNTDLSNPQESFFHAALDVPLCLIDNYSRCHNVLV